MKSIRDSKQLYWGLIITFFVLYFCVGFVSTLHSITFFELANSLWMAVLLGITYEVGQASVLFSILMTKNSQKMLPWLLMFLLTALQVTANVYASFKFMDSSESNDWTFWQRSILFWMETDSPEMFKVVISWITGALLPIVALGMTALVAENLKMKDEEDNAKEDEGFDDPGPGPDDLPPTESRTFTIPVGEVDEVKARKNLQDLRKSYDEKIEISNEEQVLPNSEATMKDYIEKNHGPTAEDIEEISKHVDSTIQEDLKKIKEEADSSGVEPVVVPSKTERLNSFAEELLDPKNQLKFPPDAKTPGTPGVVEVVKEPIEIDLDTDTERVDPDDWRNLQPNNWDKEAFLESPIDNPGPEPLVIDKSKEATFTTDPNTGLFQKKPVNNKRGWHLSKEFVDDNGDVYHYGQFQEGEKRAPKAKIDPPKKAKG